MRRVAMMMMVVMAVMSGTALAAEQKTGTSGQTTTDTKPTEKDKTAPGSSITFESIALPHGLSTGSSVAGGKVSGAIPSGPSSPPKFEMPHGFSKETATPAKTEEKKTTAPASSGSPPTYPASHSPSKGRVRNTTTLKSAGDKKPTTPPTQPPAPSPMQPDLSTEKIWGDPGGTKHSR